ncbi:hypothetical protein ABID56_000885 [Alkalibacillus flavidus]|uniref:Uncharacterized protein n=1 Tax=Alkalibacillus flavidus TaxID=546021 RepID=A0ABV2KW54_9BACI
MTKQSYWQAILQRTDELTQLINEYWRAYSSLSSWPFWLNIVLIITPLVILYFAIDRSRLFEIMFSDCSCICYGIIRVII